MGNSSSFRQNCNVFCIPGLPINKVTATAIKNALSQFGKVISVRIPTSQDEPTRTAFVVFESGGDISAKLTTVKAITLRERKYQIKPSSMKYFVFQQYAENLQLGVLYRSKFTCMTDFPAYLVEVVCSLAPTNRISILLQQNNVNVRHKLEIEIQNIWPNILVELTPTKIILTLTLKRPPKIFTNIRADGENLNHWQADTADTWGRDIDFTAEERIGVCLTYRLVLPYSEHLHAFLPINEHYQVKGTIYNNHLLWPVVFLLLYRTVLSVRRTSWFRSLWTRSSYFRLQLCF
jgi:hypothetical protein